ncbi:DUF2189 domain-containing protein [Chelatococcus sp. GCM10030263]|uniref:DUF2189 domain-containing protein n=1 Tax=Chelatococcus sp. GCM10030263 TaxID=3273387 RepID=UPI003615C74F
MTIRNPVEWSLWQLNQTMHAAGTVGTSLYHDDDAELAQSIPISRIGMRDLREALARGLDDFLSNRSDIIFVALIYPLAGIVLSQIAVGYSMLPIIFPLASGFALIGPFAATGLYEMSRRRERGETITWVEAFGVFRSPAFGSIVLLGVIVIAFFLLWLLTAMWIYDLTLGPDYPTSFSTFLHEVLTTPAGWALVAIGSGVGFIFALLALAATSISFPLLLDRNVGVMAAINASVRAFLRNPLPMLAWGAIVTLALILGSLPLLVGLVVVMPVLGHATWHLYRRITGSDRPNMGNVPEAS